MQRHLLFVGPWSHASGLGVAARGALQALWHLPEPWRIEAQAPEHWGPHAPISPHRQLLPAGLSEQEAAARDPHVTWLHCNPDAACTQLSEALRARIRRSRHVVATWVWESAQLPASWHRALAWIDQLWVPSRAVQQLLQPYTHHPVRVIPHLLPIPERPPQHQRERVILFVFDGASNLQRKNPLLLLEAFERSGLAAQGWRLILKTQHLDAAGSDPALLAAFRQRLAAAQQAIPDAVQLINQPLPTAELSSLYARAAIVASPHSGEGFGLTLAEAMAQGCLVVATDHGGSRDWLQASTGFPVPAPLHCSTHGWGAYPAGSVWAQPTADTFKDALQAAARCFEDPPAAEALRQRAHARLHSLCSRAAVSQRIAAALASLEDPMP